MARIAVTLATKYDAVLRFRKGHYRENIAKFLGVSIRSVHRWARHYRNRNTKWLTAQLEKLTPPPPPIEPMPQPAIATSAHVVRFGIDLTAPPIPTREDIGEATLRVFQAMKDLGKLIEKRG